MCCQERQEKGYLAAKCANGREENRLNLTTETRRHKSI